MPMTGLSEIPVIVSIALRGCRIKTGVPGTRKELLFMSVLRNIPIARKFFVAFGIVCGLCIVLGIFTYLTFRDIDHKSLNVSADGFPSVVALAGIRDGFNTERRAELAMLLCATPPCAASYNTKRVNGIEAYQRAIKAYETLVSTPQEHDLFQKI